MIEKIKKELFDSQEKKYQSFSSKLLPNTKNILGVRLPILKKIAKKIQKNNQTFDFIQKNTDEFFELTMIEAFLINSINDYDLTKEYLKNFISKINNWSICDSLCCGLKIIKNNQEDFKFFLEKYFDSKKEFELRFAYVILLNFYIEDNFEYVKNKIIKFNNESYYSKMAVAWLLSYCFIKKFDKTLDFIKNNKIHDFVLKKGITKSKESYQLTKEQKETLSTTYSIIAKGIKI